MPKYISVASTSVWQTISDASRAARTLIPREYHLYVVYGIIVLCTIFTVLSITFLAKRVAKRHFRGPAHLSKTSLNQLDTLDLGAILAANAIVIPGAFIATAILLGPINLLVVIAGYVALIGLITTACKSYNRRQRTATYLYGSTKRNRYDQPAANPHDDETQPRQPAHPQPDEAQPNQPDPVTSPYSSSQSDE